MILHDSIIYEKQENSLFSYFNPIQTTERKPTVMWKKSPIKMEVWKKILDISAYTYEKFKSECVERLYYNQSLDAWAVEFFPQEMTGMTVSDELDTEILKTNGMLPEHGWIEAGSVHHHCSSSAFQSGTDESDEFECPGLHITIGKLKEKELDIHARFLTPSGFQDPYILSFFEHPSWIDEIPEEYQEDLKIKVMSKLLKSPGNPKEADPKWIERCYERKIVKTPNKSWYGGYEYGYGYKNQFPPAEQGRSVHTKSEQLELNVSEKSQKWEQQDLIQQCEQGFEDLVLDTFSYTDLEDCDEIIQSLNMSKSKLDKDLRDWWTQIRNDLKMGKKENKEYTMENFINFIKENKFFLDSEAIAQRNETNRHYAEETDTNDEIRSSDNELCIV